MFENIPNIYMTALVALAVTGFVAVLMCVSRYLENAKENAIARKNARLAGTDDYDTVNEALGRKFWYGYLIVAIVGAGVSVVLALIAVDMIDAYLEIADPSRLMVLSVAVSLMVWVICDKYLFTRLGDSAYFARVESSAISAFLGDRETETKDPVDESETEDPLANLTPEEKRALVERLFK